MVYKYIYAVVRRNTNSRPPQYEKPSLYKYCAFGNIVLRTGGLGFFSFSAGTVSGQAPLLQRHLPWLQRWLSLAGSCQKLPRSATWALIHLRPKALGHTFCFSCWRTGRVRFPSDKEWRWQKHWVTLKTPGAMVELRSSASLTLLLRKAALNPLLMQVSEKALNSHALLCSI